jgi:diadenosine tetraphosphate (Ap4A) HIT family hydrolase
MTFALHPNLAQKTFVADLPLCRLLLEDEKHYPWLLLVPRRPVISKLIDLSPGDQLQCLQELDWAQRVMWDLFKPTQLNVAAIGNKTPQLHIHVIARFEDDPAWPSTVWDHPVREPYDEMAKQERVAQIREAMSHIVLKLSYKDLRLPVN